MARTGAEQLFWSEIRSEFSTRRSLAICYAMLVADNLKSGPEFWSAVNQAVIVRFKIKTEADFLAFQRKAKEIYVAAASQICPVFNPPEQKKEEAANGA